MSNILALDKGMIFCGAQIKSEPFFIQTTSNNTNQSIRRKKIQLVLSNLNKNNFCLFSLQSGKKKATEPVASGAVASTDQPAVKKHKIQVDEENSRGSSVSPKSGGSGSPHQHRATESPSRAASTPTVAPTDFLQKDKIEASKEAALEAEHQAAQVRAQLPLEQRIIQFKEMLVEKEVSAYSTWERELQKIVFDPRYLLLNSRERKQAFERYVKERATQESKEKAVALKRKRDAFVALMREAGVGLKTVYAEFAARHAKDERLRAVEKTKEREAMFNDFVSDLRKAEKEEKYAEKEKLRKSFVAMLKELKPPLHRHSSWTETKKLIEADPRYKAVESSTKREDYFREHCKYLDEKPQVGVYSLPFFCIFELFHQLFRIQIYGSSFQTLG